MFAARSSPRFGVWRARGALVLARGEGDAMKVTVLTLWDSMASIQRFAGTDATAAVVEPEAQALLTGFDARVEHFARM